MDVVGTWSTTSPHRRRALALTLALVGAALVAGIALLGLVPAPVSSPCRGGALPAPAGCRPPSVPRTTPIPAPPPATTVPPSGTATPLTTGGRRPSPRRHVHVGALSPPSPAPDTTSTRAAPGASSTTLVPTTVSPAATSPPDSAAPAPADTAPSTTTSTMPPTTTTAPVLRSSVRDEAGDDRS
ncbi:MAG TPA: hypothetical protein VMB72_14295 [Acidimicrobiales bacterium]|nr:hypothetical protein [Acidimicrobiales bacterium]